MHPLDFEKNELRLFWVSFTELPAHPAKGDDAKDHFLVDTGNPIRCKSNTSEYERLLRSIHCVLALRWLRVHRGLARIIKSYDPRQARLELVELSNRTDRNLFLRFVGIE